MQQNGWIWFALSRLHVQPKALRLTCPSPSGHSANPLWIWLFATAPVTASVTAHCAALSQPRAGHFGLMAGLETMHLTRAHVILLRSPRPSCIQGSTTGIFRHCAYKVQYMQKHRHGLSHYPCSSPDIPEDFICQFSFTQVSHPSDDKARLPSHSFFSSPPES